MSDPLLPEEDGATPLSDEEREGLKLSYVTTRGDLNGAEQQNILKARTWAQKRKNKVLTRDYLNDLHKRMYGDVWTWAGTYRTTEKSIGIDPIHIQVQLQELLDNVNYWIENETYPPDEIAARFHHKLVYIHPYPNGNGRHARLAADILLKEMGQDPFTWGRANLRDAGEARKTYIDALRAADGHDIGPLLEFVRS
ncbi:MAG: mobile mystery protein B [Pseudomonadales bacterium]